MARNNTPADEPIAEVPAASSAAAEVRIETNFEIVDNTEVEAPAPVEAESEESDLGNGMILVNYR